MVGIQFSNSVSEQRRVNKLKSFRKKNRGKAAQHGFSFMKMSKSWKGLIFPLDHPILDVENYLFGLVK